MPNWKVPEGVTLEVTDYYREDREDSSFYTFGDTYTVASITAKGRELSVVCLGEMRIEMPDITIRYADDLIEAGFTNDDEVATIEEKGGEWINNSWFEVFIEDYGDTDYTVFHTVSEAIEHALEIAEKELSNA
jgi:hypothetical protein